ncbi:MAG: hypothetical protein WKF47_03775 [Geodermatophilaceae bacterium]
MSRCAGGERRWPRRCTASAASTDVPSGPAAHFRTSAHTGSLFAAAVASLLGRVDAALGHPAHLDLVDVGAGRGELLWCGRPAGRGRPAVRAAAATHRRRGGCPAQSVCRGRSPGPARSRQLTGLLLANEWLDVVPVDVAELTPDGPQLVLVGCGRHRSASVRR